MYPGFVNAECPIFRTTELEQAREAGLNFATNPLTGKPFASDPVSNSAEELVPRKLRTIHVPLYLSPIIPMQWRAVGFDGAPTLPVPDFFLKRGVRRSPLKFGADLLGEDAEVYGSDFDVPADLRLLRACDIILHKPRVALTSQVSLEAGPATGVSNVTQTLSLRTPPPGDKRLRVFSGYFSPPSQGIDPRLVGSDYEEPTFDQRLISTVYLLSPPKTPLGSAPDGAWIPFVRHGLFWSLNWEQPQLQVLNSDPGTPFIPPLAAGAAQLVINFLTASINDLTAQSLNILSAHSMAGTWWTPTGSGFTAAFPAEEETPAKGITGSDKTGRLAEQRRRRRQRARAERLDLVFPFEAVPFSRSLLSEE